MDIKWLLECIVRDNLLLRYDGNRRDGEQLRPARDETVICCSYQPFASSEWGFASKTAK